MKNSCKIIYLLICAALIFQTVSTAQPLQDDAALLACSPFSTNEGGLNVINRSLNLPDRGADGSTIVWSSSDENHITNAGRVIRPRWYEENAQVTMTATINNNGQISTETFDFIVLKDEKWADPSAIPGSEFMTDNEFFGVWDGTTWTVRGKLDYEYPGLETVGDAVKAGDIPLAKERLLSYFANCTPKTNISLANRNTNWAKAFVDDFYSLHTADYYQGEISVGNQWEEYEAAIRTDNISRGGTSSFGVRAWYNEASYAEIKRHNDPNMAFRPRIELTVNGEPRVYYAVDSIGIRAGAFKDTNYNNEETVTVQTFGDFLGDDTRHGVIKFAFPDLDAKDIITTAKLVLYAKAFPSFSGPKRLIIVGKEVNTWNSATAKWRDFPGSVYSYNGLPDGNSWTKPDGADNEFLWQSSRFKPAVYAVVEYLVTDDDTYMYKFLRILNNYLIQTQNYKTVGRYGQVNPNGLRGSFVRTLDAALKNQNIIGLIDVIAKYEHTTPEFFTAILKNIWDTNNYLTYYHSNAGNWRQFEFQSLLYSTNKIPEFYDAHKSTAADGPEYGIIRCLLNPRCESCVWPFANWNKLAKDELESLLFLNTLDDGSYIEDTCGYSHNAFTNFTNYKYDLQADGDSVSPEYDALLHLAAYYNILLFTPNGYSLQYGDDQLVERGTTAYERVASWYNDAELDFINTYGKSGSKPEWTSRHWPKSTVTAMRADWTTDSPYLFTNVRGQGVHGHADDNAVIVYAYGRTLLNDAGIMSYTSSDPLRVWGSSTVAHNTVVVNDTSQANNTAPAAGLTALGVAHDWATNSSFDYLGQSTMQNKGFEHRRSILFVKDPGFWIVSDLLVPEKDDGSSNNYKQVWHMPPESNLEVSQENRTIYSNYPAGANMIVASADGSDEALKTAMGYYDKNYMQIQEAPYAYFEKEGAGTVTFDTVLMPSNNDTTAAVTAEKITAAGNATAVKINYTLKGESNTGYYYMSYDNNPGIFGKYSTDGRLAFVRENAGGNIAYLLIRNGTYIKNELTGEYLLQSETLLDEYVVEHIPETIEWKISRLYKGTYGQIGTVKMIASQSSSVWGQSVDPYAKFFSNDVKAAIVPYMQSGKSMLSLQLSGTWQQYPNEVAWLRWTEPTGRPQLVFTFKDNTVRKIPASVSAHVRGGSYSDTFVNTNGGNFAVNGLPPNNNNARIGYVKFDLSSVMNDLERISTVQVEITPYRSDGVSTRPAEQALAGDFDIGIYMIGNNDWDPETITMNTRPRETELAKLQPGDNHFMVTVKNNYNEQKTHTLIFAVYNSSGVLQHCACEDVVLGSGEEKTIHKFFTLPDGEYSLKAYAWDGFGNNTPLGGVLHVK